MNTAFCIIINLFMAYKYPICDVFHWFCKIARFFATEPFCPPCPNFIASMAAYPLLSFSFKVSKYAFICFSISSEYFMRSIKFESFITCDSFQLALDIGTVIREIIYLLSHNERSEFSSVRDDLWLLFLY